MLKGFIEVTDTETNEPCLINIDWIEEVVCNSIYLAFSISEARSQDYIRCEETYEEIKQKIAEAQQVPKKPLKIKASKDVNLGAAIFKAGSTVYKCPHCESFILRSSKYCNKCGQALDWNDEK